MPQLRTRCDAHHKKALCVGQERRVVCSADGPSGTHRAISVSIEAYIKALEATDFAERLDKLERMTNR